jgi:glycosyltransferase involved in cell wall biosynthesis
MKNKTTVFLLHNVGDNNGGAEQSFVYLVNSICSLQYRAIVILPDIKGNLALRLNTECILVQLPLLRFHRTYNPFRLFFFFANLITCQLRLMMLMKKYKADIVHSNTTNTHLYVALPSKILGVRSVWHVRDALPSLLVSKLLTYCSNRIFCVSLKVVPSRWTNNKKVVFVPNALDTSEYNINASGSKICNVSKKEFFIIAQIGQLIPWKNHRLTIAVAERLLHFHKKFEFLIIGSDMFNAYPNYKLQLLQLIEKRGVSAHVRFIPYERNLHMIYPEIDILFHPALNEPFGRVILEAMSYAKPVVAINNCGPSDIVVDNETGFLVDDNNLDEITARILMLLENNQLRVKMGSAGRRRVVEYYNIDAQKLRLKEQYQQLLYK